MFLLIKIIIPTTIRRITDKFEVVEKIFLVLNSPINKITIIPNGVEKRFAEAEPTLFHNKYGVKDFILNVGHIGVDRKKTLSLIRALSKIDHPAVIIGRIFPSKEADLCLEE